MYFLRKTTIYCLVVLYIQIDLVSCFDCKGDDYVQVKPYLTCRKIYNCRPGFEILDCDQQCQPLKCVKCANGHVQPDLIHWDSPHKTCFKKTEQHTCTEDDITYAHLGDLIEIRSCPKSQFCKCNNDKCFYGPDPCICNRQFNACRENETLDGKSGRCIPCPSGHVSPPGCGACFKDTREKAEPTTVPVHVTSTEPTEAAAKSTGKLKLTTDFTTERGTFNIVTSLVDDDNKNLEIKGSAKNTDENSASGSTVILIGIILGLVLLVICIAAFMFMRYRRNRQRTILNDDEEGQEMDRVPPNNQPQNLRVDKPNGGIPRDNHGGDNVNEPERRPLLNGNCHRDIGDQNIGDDGEHRNGDVHLNGDIHHNGDGDGGHQIGNGPAQIGAGRNVSYLQDNREIDYDVRNESSLPSEKNMDPEVFRLQRTLNIKKGSHGGHTSVTVAPRSDTSTSEAGCPVASPSTDINPFEGGASGTSRPLEGDANGAKLSLSVGVDINLQTHRQESKSENNKPIASPSDSESPDSSLNSNDPQVNPKRLVSGGTEPLPSYTGEVNYKSGQMTPDENEEDTEQKRSYRRSMGDSGYDTNK